MGRVIDYPMTRQGVRDLDNPIRLGHVNVGAGVRAAFALGGAALALAELMGHRDGTTLARVYGHLDRDTAHLKRALAD